MLNNSIYMIGFIVLFIAASHAINKGLFKMNHLYVLPSIIANILISLVLTIILNSDPYVFKFGFPLNYLIIYKKNAHKYAEVSKFMYNVLKDYSFNLNLFSFVISILFQSYVINIIINITHRILRKLS